MNYVGFVDICENATIPEGFDKYYWASKNCVFAIEKCKKEGLAYEVLPWFWNDQNIKNEIDYLLEQKEILLGIISAQLNEYHNVEYKRDTWDIAIGLWLLEYIESFHDKYVNLVRLNDLGIELYCDVYPEENCVVPIDHFDFERLMFDDDFNLYQYSMLYWAFKEQFGKIKVRNILEYKRKELTYPQKTFGYYKTIIYRRVVSIIKILLNRHDIVSVNNAYFPNEYIVSQMVRSGFKISNYIVDYSRTTRKKLDTRCDAKIRKSYGGSMDSFDAFLQKSVFRLLPTAQIENYDYLKSEMMKIYVRGQNVKAAFFTAEGLSYNELIKVYLMTLKEKGAKLCGIQHGGPYGIDLFPYMISEFNICDNYYTWGWDITGKYNCKFIPMPATKLMSKTYKKNICGEDILYVGYTHSKYIHYMVKRIVDYTNDVDKERTFLKELYNYSKDSIRVRLFPGEELWGIKKKLISEIPEINIDHINDFCESIAAAKMVIVSEWATSFAEALFMNKPTIVHRSLSLSEELAKQDLDDLHEAGILADNWDEMFEFVRDACQDIDTWWQDKRRQEVIRRIKNKYIKMDANAEKMWQKELYSYF